MATEEDTIISSKVKKESAIFDFGDLYDFCFTWLVDEDYEVIEESYSEEIEGEGKELEIIWSAEKEISDYFRFKIKIRWFIIGMKDVEVERDGSQVKMNKGDFEIGAKGVLEKDYEHSWEKNSFYKFLRKIYDRYIIRGRVEQYEDEVYIDVDEFLAQVKAFLSLEGKR